MQEKFQILISVLKKFEKAGILSDFVLIGSWCLYFYKDYFINSEFNPTIRTKDLDLLIPEPAKISKKVDLLELLKKDGFLVTFDNNGYLRLEHPELIIEFLVIEKGKGAEKPIEIKQLGVNAQALRFINFLSQNVIELKSKGLVIKVPHPAAYGLHKLLISTRRKEEYRILKEKKEALLVLRSLIESGEVNIIVELFKTIPKSWGKKYCLC